MFGEIANQRGNCCRFPHCRIARLLKNIIDTRKRPKRRKEDGGTSSNLLRVKYVHTFPRVGMNIFESNESSQQRAAAFMVAELEND